MRRLALGISELNAFYLYSNIMHRKEYLSLLI